MNLEACYIYKDIQENKKITYKNRDLAKLFSATIPYSLETIRMNNMFPDTFYSVNKKQYTRKIINVTFEKNYFIWDEATNTRKTIANKKKIRKYLYNNGFIMDDIHYVFYKRGSGKAKNGYAFFIQREMREVLLNRSRLGVRFEESEEVDLTSLLAYESLISSGIESTIKLNPKTEILIIDDIYGKEFQSKASITREIDGKIVTKDELINLKNCLSDGQGLLDESVFAEYKKEDKGFMLLRSDMFKNCAFNTKLQKWFKSNNITTLTDMFENVYDATKIKLIITPNSLKFLKFAYKIGDGSKKECYEYWQNHVDDVFGVVKHDKEGNYGTYNRTTYQLLNSISNLTKEELEIITEQERDYVMLLKNDFAVFRNYLCSDNNIILEFEESLDDGDLSSFENVDLMNALLLVNSDIQYTKKFKMLKTKLISNYIEHLKEGKIRLKDTKYVTLISNPYEMLLATISKYNNTSIMENREVYCPYYQNNQTFCVSRNPHINSGNVMSTTNIYHKEYDEWFNFTDNICAINFYDNDAPDRLQGCDTDSDAILLIPESILSSKAKYCEKYFATPIKKVEGKSIPRRYNMNEIYKLDVILSDNYIGKIVNLSQIINSYMNDAIANDKTKNVIDDLYQASSKLSSLSQIEIDKSKKVFDNVSMSKELSNIRKLPHLKMVEEKDKRGEMVKKMVVPMFFSMISEFNEYRIFEKFNTPLDILQDILVFKNADYQKGEKNKDFRDLLVQPKDIEGRYQQNSAEAIYKIISDCGKRINGLRTKSCKLNNKAKKTVERKSKKEAIEKLRNLNPNEATILSVLKQSFSEEHEDKLGFSKYGMLALNLLFVSKKVEVLKCFKSANTDMDDILIKIKDKYDFDIFGDKYQKVKRKEINI
jgi:hypothetical protein